LRLERRRTPVRTSWRRRTRTRRSDCPTVAPPLACTPPVEPPQPRQELLVLLLTSLVERFAGGRVRIRGKTGIVGQIGAECLKESARHGGGGDDVREGVRVGDSPFVHIPPKGNQPGAKVHERVVGAAPADQEGRTPEVPAIRSIEVRQKGASKMRGLVW